MVTWSNIKPPSEPKTARAALDLHRINFVDLQPATPSIWSPDFVWPTYEAYFRHEMRAGHGDPLLTRLRQLGLEKAEEHRDEHPPVEPQGQP